MITYCVNNNEVFTQHCLIYEIILEGRVIYILNLQISANHTEYFQVHLE